jgi:LDH2 family malate/lactate/ureidoglycolate dehydrogenase
MDTCMKLADEYGIGVVMVDNAFHYRRIPPERGSAER